MAAGTRAARRDDGPLRKNGNGVEHRTAPISIDQAKRMAAVFATNTSIGVRALSAIDDKELPAQHPVLSALRETYLSIPGETL